MDRNLDNSNSVKMRYFDQYCELIDSGKINVNKWVALQIERVKGFKTKYKFIQEEADAAIDFIESQCSHTKGKRGLLKLHLAQKVWLEVSYGFYYDKEIIETDLNTLEERVIFEERRLTNETAEIVPRGTGKTTKAAAIAKYMQIYDGEWGASVNIIAPTRDQAGECFDASRAMNAYEESIFYLFMEKGSLRSTKRGEYFEPTNSLFSIKTLDYDTMDGSNNHANIFDEIHSMTIDPIQIMNHGSQMKRKNWQSWYISTNGVVRDSVFDQYFDKWTKILTGELIDDSCQIWIYCLDDYKEIHKPEVWDKALPLLGVTYQKSDIQKMIELSKDNPVKQAEIMAKIFNLPVNNYLSYFSNEECKGYPDKFNPDLFIGDDIQNVYATLGIDLSDVKDLSSISFKVMKDGNYYYLNKKYIPRNTFDKLPKDKRDKYGEWELAGHLTIHEHDYNDQKFIFDDIVSFMTKNKILPIKVGYDKWNAREIVRLFEERYGNVCIEVPQTVKNLSQHLKIYKELIKSGRVIFDDPVATWCHMNVNVKVDANFNVFPNKQKASDKIDVFASMLNAYVAFENSKDEYGYYF